MNPLTPSEQSRLEELEAKIAGNIDAIFETADALREIRDLKLYRLEHQTFEEYVQTKWGRHRDWAHKLIATAEAREEASAVPIRLNPLQARALATAPRGTRKEVLKAASEDGEATPQKIRQAAQAVRNDQAKLGKPKVSLTDRQEALEALRRLYLLMWRLNIAEPVMRQLEDIHEALLGEPMDRETVRTVDSPYYKPTDESEHQF